MGWLIDASAEGRGYERFALVAMVIGILVGAALTVLPYVRALRLPV